jgi:hypothetical protein
MIKAIRKKAKKVPKKVLDTAGIVRDGQHCHFLEVACFEI